MITFLFLVIAFSLFFYLPTQDDEGASNIGLFEAFPEKHDAVTRHSSNNNAGQGANSKNSTHMIDKSSVFDLNLNKAGVVKPYPVNKNEKFSVNVDIKEKLDTSKNDFILKEQRIPGNFGGPPPLISFPSAGKKENEASFQASPVLPKAGF